MLSWRILNVAWLFPRSTQRLCTFNICWVSRVWPEVHWQTKVDTLSTEVDQEMEEYLDAPHYSLPALQPHWKREWAFEIPGMQHRLWKKWKVWVNSLNDCALRLNLMAIADCWTFSRFCRWKWETTGQSNYTTQNNFGNLVSSYLTQFWYFVWSEGLMLVSKHICTRKWISIPHLKSIPLYVPVLIPNGSLGSFLTACIYLDWFWRQPILAHVYFSLAPSTA